MSVFGRFSKKKPKIIFENFLRNYGKSVKIAGNFKEPLKEFGEIFIQIDSKKF